MTCCCLQMTRSARCCKGHLRRKGFCCWEAHRRQVQQMLANNPLHLARIWQVACLQCALNPLRGRHWPRHCQPAFAPALATRTDAAGCQAAASLDGTQLTAPCSTQAKQLPPALGSRLDRLCSALHCTCVPRSPLPKHCLPRHRSPQLDRCQHKSCLCFILHPLPPDVPFVHTSMHEQPFCFLQALELTRRLCFALMCSGNPSSKRCQIPLTERSMQDCASEDVLKGGKEGWPELSVPKLAKGCPGSCCLASLQQLSFAASAETGGSLH